MAQPTQPEIRIVQSINHHHILEWMREMRLKAYVAGSGYKVSAVFAMKRVKDYVLAGGVNVECLDHRLSSHGENSAIALLTTAFGKKAALSEGWTLGSPQHLTGPSDDPLADAYGFTCGVCRQHINDFAIDQSVNLHSFNLNGGRSTKTLGFLLPDNFSFSHFIPSVTVTRQTALQTQESVGLDVIHRRIVRREPQSLQDVFNWMASLESIDYASNLDQSVVLRLDNGAYVAGVKVENAAYAGTSAMASALCNAVSTFGAVGVKEIYALSRCAAIPSDAVYPLPLSALQNLAEFVQADDHTVSVTLFTLTGDFATLPLKEAKALPVSYAKPYVLVRNGALTPIL